MKEIVYVCSVIVLAHVLMFCFATTEDQRRTQQLDRGFQNSPAWQEGQARLRNE